MTGKPLLHSPGSVSLHQISAMAVSFSLPDPRRTEQRHIGLLYKTPAGSLRHLHLAWHYRMSCDDPFQTWLEDGRAWGDVLAWAALGLDEVNQMLLAEYCEMVRKANADGKIPYGIHASAQGFDPQTGTFRLPPNEGLTCATFVLSLFESFGFVPLLRSSWPPRLEDIEWQKQILALLETRTSQEYVEAQRNFLGSAVRFRPEEVAAGLSLYQDRPLPFSDISLPAQALLEQLRALMAEPQTPSLP